MLTIVATIGLIILSKFHFIGCDNCRQSTEVADKCAKNIMIFGNSDVIIPVTENDLDKHCNKTLESIRCLRQFGRQCLPVFPRHALGIFTKTLRRVIISRCRQQKERSQFLEFAKCWTPKERLQKTNICVDKHIIQLEYINKRVEPEFHIPAICCTFQQRNACILREISKICDQKNVEYVLQLFERSTGRLTAFACSKYLSMEDCDRYFSSNVWIPLKKFVETEDEKGINGHKHQSILAPIVEIITQFKF